MPNFGISNSQNEISEPQKKKNLGISEEETSRNLRRRNVSESQNEKNLGISE
jgi:hypothetical protein